MGMLDKLPKHIREMMVAVALSEIKNTLESAIVDANDMRKMFDLLIATGGMDVPALRMVGLSSTVIASGLVLQDLVDDFEAGARQIRVLTGDAQYALIEKTGKCQGPRIDIAAYAVRKLKEEITGLVRSSPISN